MKKSLAKNAAYKAILNIFNLLVPLLVNPYITRVLDIELYGMYNRVYAQFTVFLTLAAFGIYNYGIREISRVRDDKEKVNKIFTSLFIIGILSNAIVGVFYVFYFTQASTGVDFYVYMIMMIQLVANIFYIEFINEAIENYGFITLKTIIIRIFYFISIFLFVRQPEDIIPYTFIICLTILANNFVSYVYLRRQIKFDFKNFQILKHIIPLFIALILANVEILYGQLDKLMIGHYLGDVAVSFYTIPTTLMGMVATVPLSLISVSMPSLSMMLGRKDIQGYNESLAKTKDVFFAMLTPMCFGVAVLAQEIMLIYSGEEYVAASALLIIAALARYFSFGFQSIVMNLIMYINNLEKPMVVYLGVFGCFNLISNFLLVIFNCFTIETALLTTALATFLFNVLVFKYSKKHLNLQVTYMSKNQWRYLIVSLLFVPISLVVKMIPCHMLIHVALVVVLCASLYFGSLIYWKDEAFMTILRKFKLDKLLRIK